MADLTVLIPAVSSSYSILHQVEYDESTYVTTSASVDVLLTDISISYSILAMSSGVVAAPQQQSTQVWHFS
jgi:hypothetical protein